MSILRFIRTAIFGCDLTIEERPEVDGWAAWEAFQQAHDQKVGQERRRHGRPGEVEAHRKALVHSALGLAASRSIPTAPSSGGCSGSEATA